MKKDIESEEDVKLFSDAFYSKILNDDDIKHHFEGLDMDSHMEQIYGFWNKILLGTGDYHNNTMQAHAHLKLEKEHFYVWLRHFQKTINELFEGDKADEAISRANSIAMIMRYKLLGI